MAIITGSQFTGGLKTLGTQTNKSRELIQELLITAVYFAERDGDVSSIQRVVDAVSNTKAYDMWKIHAWLKKYDAPIKPSDDGKTYVYNAKKRHLSQSAPRSDFAPYETVMRQEPAWYESKKADPTPAQAWGVETGFENFIKKLISQGYNEAADAVKASLVGLKRDGKLRTLKDKLASDTAKQKANATEKDKAHKAQVIKASGVGKKKSTPAKLAIVATA